MAASPDRGTWASKRGFVLAAAGSAVGLGNIWRFPTQVGQGGGAVFVLVYLACVVFICFPIMIAELAVGRRAQKDPVGSFDAIKPGAPPGGWSAPWASLPVRASSPSIR